MSSLVWHENRKSVDKSVAVSGRRACPPAACRARLSASPNGDPERVALRGWYFNGDAERVSLRGSYFNGDSETVTLRSR